MALLHALWQSAADPAAGLSLVVAHFDHGIREDSAQDRQLVAAVARDYGLDYVYDEGFLGAGASEARAREARYGFLEQVRVVHDADAIITAHHQDDVVETALLNMLRGTKGRGLGSLRSAGKRVRPLLGVTKADIIAYATEHTLRWREDSTNQDERYVRNYVRRNVVPKMSLSQREQLLQTVHHAQVLQAEIDQLLLPHSQSGQLDRRWFIALPHVVAREAMAAWLRQNSVAFNRRTIERLVVFAKTALPGKAASVDAGHTLTARKDHIILLPL